MEQAEKKFKSSIVKSLRYFQLKASFNKELKFLSLKVEGLKSCLREAKTTYQQSLKNLEKISTEVHEQRNIHKNNSDTKLLGSVNSLSKSISPNSSTSTISVASVTGTSHSSPDLSSLIEKNSTEKLVKSKSLTTLTETNKKTVPEAIRVTEESEKVEEEDYDKYFNDTLLKYSESEFNQSFTKTVHYSQKLDKNAICLLSDEDIENLRLEKKLKKFENDLLNKRKTEEIQPTRSNEKLNTSSETATPNRSQFRVPFFSKS